MKKYKFNWVNSGLEIVNPKITVSEDNLTLFPSNMTIDVDILLETEKNVRVGIRLNEIKVQNYTHDKESLIKRVLERLKDFEV